MPNHHLVRVLRLLAIAALLLAPSARAELAAWDQAKVTGLAKELETATDALYETFRQQPPPNLGSMQSESYYRLKQLVRRSTAQVDVFVKSLEEGEGRDQTGDVRRPCRSRAAPAPRPEGLRREGRRGTGGRGAGRAEPARPATTIRISRRSPHIRTSSRVRRDSGRSPRSLSVALSCRLHGRLTEDHETISRPSCGVLHARVASRIRIEVVEDRAAASGAARCRPASGTHRNAFPGRASSPLAMLVRTSSRRRNLDLRTAGQACWQCRTASR